MPTKSHQFMKILGPEYGMPVMYIFPDITSAATLFFVELVVGLSNNRKANACIMITLAIMRQNSLAAAELPRHDDLCPNRTVFSAGGSRVLQD